MATKLSNVFRKFHSDEEGLEALQVVMIIAIAAVILVAAGTVGQSVVDFTKEKLNALKDKQVNGYSRPCHALGGPVNSGLPWPPSAFFVF